MQIIYHLCLKMVCGVPDRLVLADGFCSGVVSITPLYFVLKLENSVTFYNKVDIVKCKVLIIAG